ncbi:hypothetical protein SNEBB_008326 [Seison nebaliae]|nr:hypothetical protein SNEBB_008326 [Seison nebaliae]
MDVTNKKDANLLQRENQLLEKHRRHAIREMERSSLETERKYRNIPRRKNFRYQEVSPELASFRMEEVGRELRSLQREENRKKDEPMKYELPKLTTKQKQKPFVYQAPNERLPLLDGPLYQLNGRDIYGSRQPETIDSRKSLISDMSKEISKVTLPRSRDLPLNSISRISGSENSEPVSKPVISNSFRKFQGILQFRHQDWIFRHSFRLRIVYSIQNSI